MMILGIKNRLFFHPAKLSNILDINLNKISVKDILSDDDDDDDDDNDLAKYYIKYNNNIFYLVINDEKRYFEKINGDNYLTIIFDNEKYEKIFKSIFDKTKKISLISILENIM